MKNPIKIFGIQNKGFINEGYDADFTIVDMNKKIVIKNKNIESKCGWSPFDKVEFKGTPVATIIAGKMKMKDGQILGDPEGTSFKIQLIFPVKLFTKITPITIKNNPAIACQANVCLKKT